MKSPNPTFILAAAVILCVTLASLADDPDPQSEKLIRARATLQPASRIDLHAEAGRPLPILYIAPEGKTAEKGALLVELEATPILKERGRQALQVEKARAALAAAEASFAADNQEAEALVKLGENALLVAQGSLEMFDSEQGEYQLQLRTIETEIELTEKRLALASRRAQMLANDAQTPENALQSDQAHLAVMEAEAQLRLAQARLIFLKEHLHNQKLAELKLEIARSKLDLIRARNKVSTAKATGAAALVARRAESEIETHALKTLEEQISACRIRAPKDGIVAYPEQDAAEPLEPGDVVADRRLLLSIVDNKRFKLDVIVPLGVAQKVSTGQTLTVRIDAMPDRTFKGRITTMGVVSPPRPPVEARLTVLLDDPDAKLMPGMSALVEIDLSEKTDP